MPYGLPVVPITSFANGGTAEGTMIGAVARSLNEPIVPSLLFPEVLAPLPLIANASGSIGIDGVPEDRGHPMPAGVHERFMRFYC